MCRRQVSLPLLTLQSESINKAVESRDEDSAVGERDASEMREWTCDTADRKPDSRPLRSYPSGHATLGYSVGVVLSALIPEKSQAILVRAADYAYSREVCGDHYHSDVEASRAFGTALGVLLLNNAALKPQIDAAKAELRAAHIIAE